MLDRKSQYRYTVLYGLLGKPTKCWLADYPTCILTTTTLKEKTNES